MTIYLDHNATSPLAPAVRAALTRVLGDPPANPSSLHLPGQRARDLLEEARATIAQAVGARPRELVFCSGGTEANAMALAGVAWSTDKTGLLVSAIEHPSVREYAQTLCLQARKRVTEIPVTRQGLVDLQGLEALITGREFLISVMLANHETGAVQPVEQVIALARRHGIPVHVDAAQALGRLPIDFGALGADLMTLSGHKLGAPQGVGVLLVRADLRLTPWLGGGLQEHGLRPGTENVLGALGLAAACQHPLRQGLAEASRLAGLRDRLSLGVLRRIPRVRRATPEGSHALCQTLALVFPGIDGAALVEELAQRGIAASTGAACHARQKRASPVLLAQGFSARDAQCAVRFSLGTETSVADVDATVDALAAAVATVRHHLGLEEPWP